MYCIGLLFRNNLDYCYYVNFQKLFQSLNYDIQRWDLGNCIFKLQVILEYCYGVNFQLLFQDLNYYIQGWYLGNCIFKLQVIFMFKF